MADPFQARLEERRRALQEGLDVLQWTFDPFDAESADLGIRRLGAIVTRQDEQGAVIAEWWIRRPHVERRLGAGALLMRARDAAEAPVVPLVSYRPLLLQPISPMHGRRFWVELCAPDASTRRDLRAMLAAAFADGYRIVDFMRTEGSGRYLLARPQD